MRQTDRKIETGKAYGLRQTETERQRDSVRLRQTQRNRHRE